MRYPRSAASGTRKNLARNPLGTDFGRFAGCLTVELMLGPTPGGDGLAGSFHLPLAAVETLLRGGWGGAEAPLSRPLYVQRGRPNKILAHEDVRLGVERLLRQPLTIDAIRLRLIEAYGAGRTPSRTVIGSYVRLRRIELGLQPGDRPSIR